MFVMTLDLLSSRMTTKQHDMSNVDIISDLARSGSSISYDQQLSTYLMYKMRCAQYF